MSRLQLKSHVLTGGRDANSEDLGLQALNISIGQYGRINVDQYFRTTSYQNIYAVGDVTGISGLASTAQYQARYVVESIFRNQAIKDDNRGDMDESDEDLDVDRDSFFSLGSNNEGINLSILLCIPFTCKSCCIIIFE